MSGCVIALLAVGGVGLIGVVVVAFVLWRVSQNPDVQKVLAAGKDGLRLVQEAQSAPGTAELRAAGCDGAFAFEMKQLMEVANRFSDAGPRPSDDQVASRMVSCQVSSAAGAPTCDDIARAYVRAAPGAAGRVLVVVQVRGDRGASCQKMYSPTGESLGDFTGNAPQIPAQ